MQVRITNTGQLLDLQRRLRRAGDENLRRSMQRRIRRAAEPLRDDLKSTMRSLRISSPGRTVRGGPSPTTRPLRATIAAAIRISVRTTGGGAGARVWIDKAALPTDLRNMPAVINEGRIRHPVFGNRKRWSTEWAQPAGWWDRTIRKDEPRMKAQVARVMDDVKNRLGG